MSRGAARAVPPQPEAVLLAAGAGARLGRPKALLELHGRWMLPRLVEQLAAGGAERVHVVVAAGCAEEVERRGLRAAARILVAAAPELGRGASLACGLAAVADDRAVLVHPCDVPLLRAAAVRELLAAWLALPDRDDWVLRPVTQAGRGGHPLLLGAARARAARRLRPEQSLREILHADPDRRRDLVQTDPGPFLEVNTPEQQAWLESLLPG
jgi:nicotine blue oxidoreductase